MAAASDVIMLLVVAMETNKAASGFDYLKVQRTLIIYVSNIYSIGWMVLKVEGRGQIYPPPPALGLRVTFFYLMPSMVKPDRGAN